jgi:carbon monoxide dehydrogenase subunit G
VPAGIDEAWAVLLDVERVAPCLPGAQVEPAGDDGEFNGTMTVKIGPITARYKGSVKIEEADEPARRAVMRAQAKDARGQGTAAATITSTMESAPEGGTKVKVVTDMRVTGPAAQFGRGVMQDVSAKMMRQFADCLAQEMQGAGAQTGGEAVAGGPVPGDQASVPVETAPSAGGEVLTPPDAGPAEATAPSGGGEVLAGGGTEHVAEPPKARPTPEVLDLGEVSREAVLKRAAPVVGAMLVMLILLRIIRR